MTRKPKNDRSEAMYDRAMNRKVIELAQSMGNGASQLGMIKHAFLIGRRQGYAMAKKSTAKTAKKKMKKAVMTAKQAAEKLKADRAHIAALEARESELRADAARAQENLTRDLQDRGATEREIADLHTQGCGPGRLTLVSADGLAGTPI